MSESTSGYYVGETFVVVSDAWDTFSVPKACSPAFAKSLRRTMKRVRDGEVSLSDRHSAAEQRDMWDSLTIGGLDVASKDGVTTMQGSLDGQSELCFTRYETDDAKRAAYRAETARMQAELPTCATHWPAGGYGSKPRSRWCQKCVDRETAQMRIVTRTSVEQSRDCLRTNAKARKASSVAFCFCSYCDSTREVAVTWLHGSKAA